MITRYADDTKPRSEKAIHYNGSTHSTHIYRRTSVLKNLQINSRKGEQSNKSCMYITASVSFIIISILFVLCHLGPTTVCVVLVQHRHTWTAPPWAFKPHCGFWLSLCLAWGAFHRGFFQSKPDKLQKNRKQNTKNMSWVDV